MTSKHIKNERLCQSIHETESKVCSLAEINEIVSNKLKHPQHTALYRPAKDGYCALSAANVLSSLVRGKSRSTMVIQKVRFEPP